MIQQSHSGLYPEKYLVQKDTCTPMFIAALFIIAKTWINSTDELIKKIWYIYTMEYFSAIKKNEIMPFATRMNLAIHMNIDFIYSVRSDRKRQISYDIIYMWNLKKLYKWIYLQNRNWLPDLENIHGYRRGKIEGRNKLGGWN